MQFSWYPVIQKLLYWYYRVVWCPALHKNYTYILWSPTFWMAGHLAEPVVMTFVWQFVKVFTQEYVHLYIHSSIFLHDVVLGKSKAQGQLYLHWRVLSVPHSIACAQYDAVFIHSLAVNQFLMLSRNGKCGYMLEGQPIRCITTTAGICGKTGTNVEVCSVSHNMAWGRQWQQHNVLFYTCFHHAPSVLGSEPVWMRPY
jgi:hypothetical protein